MVLLAPAIAQFLIGATAVSGAAIIGSHLLKQKESRVLGPLAEQKSLLETKLSGLKEKESSSRNQRLSTLRGLQLPGRSRQSASRKSLKSSTDLSEFSLLGQKFPSRLI